MDGSLLIRKINLEIKSLETEGYRRVGEVSMFGVYIYHMYHQLNRNSIMLKVYKNFAVIEKNKKVVKVIK